jgi:hypothetical protein
VDFHMSDEEPLLLVTNSPAVYYLLSPLWS